MTAHELILEGLGLKAEIVERQTRLKEIQAQLTPMAVFPEGKNTATVQGNGVMAKVANKVEYAWDQGKLNTARVTLGDEAFLGLFAFEWKPKAKKELDGFLKHSPKDKSQPVLDALTIKNSQSVSFERVEV